MIGPRIDAVSTRAAEKPAGYPARLIDRIRTVPTAAASATAEPEMPAMTKEATIPTCARPPRR